MELIQELEMVIRRLIASEVDRAVEEQLRPAMSKYMTEIETRCIPLSVKSELESRVAPFVDERIDTTLKARGSSDAISMSDVAKVSRDAIKAFVDEDLENEVSMFIERAIESHEEEGHEWDEYDDSIQRVVRKVLEKTNLLKPLVADVIRDDITFSVSAN